MIQIFKILYSFYKFLILDNIWNHKYRKRKSNSKHVRVLNENDEKIWKGKEKNICLK